MLFNIFVCIRILNKDIRKKKNHKLNHSYIIIERKMTKERRIFIYSLLCVTHIRVQKSLKIRIQKMQGRKSQFKCCSIETNELISVSNSQTDLWNDHGESRENDVIGRKGEKH